MPSNGDTTPTGYDITIELAAEAPESDIDGLRALVERVMHGEGVEPGTALSILVTDDDEVRRLNAQFLGVDEPTDVLSFPDEADDFVVGVAQPLLGDIAISIDTARRQAREHSHTLDDELAHLLVHGILHLRGYDHATGPEDEARMRAREEHYLGDLNHLHGGA